jgi:hypothetical protein
VTRVVARVRAALATRRERQRAALHLLGLYRAWNALDLGGATEPARQAEIITGSPEWAAYSTALDAASAPVRTRFEQLMGHDTDMPDAFRWQVYPRAALARAIRRSLGHRPNPAHR